MSITSIVIWIIVGAVSGWLAGQVVRGYDLGLMRNIIIGLVGAFVGGWLFGRLGIVKPEGLIGDIVVSFCGAAALLIIVRVAARIFG